jgi:hypothetical protein
MSGLHKKIQNSGNLGRKGRDPRACHIPQNVAVFCSLILIKIYYNMYVFIIIFSDILLYIVGKQKLNKSMMKRLPQFS